MLFVWRDAEGIRWDEPPLAARCFFVAERRQKSTAGDIHPPTLAIAVGMCGWGQSRSTVML